MEREEYRICNATGTQKSVDKISLVSYKYVCLEHQNWRVTSEETPMTCDELI